MIRHMKQEDLDIIAKMEAETFANPWSAEEILADLEGNPFYHYYVMEDNGKIIGYAALQAIFEQADLARIIIDPSCRKSRLGGQLLDYVIEQARKLECERVLLEVRPSNTPARALYASRGFAWIRTSEKYYSNGEDALILALGI